MTAADIAWHMRLYAAGLRHEWITPNALLYAWESDLLTVTPEGHVCKVEIKISRQDMKHDLLKPKHSQGLLMNGSFPVKSTGKRLTTGEAYEAARRKAGAERIRRQRGDGPRLDDPEAAARTGPLQVHRTSQGRRGGEPESTQSDQLAVGEDAGVALFRRQ